MFEFSPSNRYLAWRGEKEREVIKGLVIFDSSVKVEKAQAVVTVKTPTKAHQIQFDGEKTADEWYKAMLKVCTTPAK
jgi:hypothetical protein